MNDSETLARCIEAFNSATSAKDGKKSQYFARNSCNVTAKKSSINSEM
jgi:hypothetical protein